MRCGSKWAAGTATSDEDQSHCEKVNIEPKGDDAVTDNVAEEAEEIEVEVGYGSDQCQCVHGRGGWDDVVLRVEQWTEIMDKEAVPGDDGK